MMSSEDLFLMSNLCAEKVGLMLAQANASKQGVLSLLQR